MDSKRIARRFDYDMHGSQTYPDVPSRQPDPQHRSQDLKSRKSECRRRGSGAYGKRNGSCEEF